MVGDINYYISAIKISQQIINNFWGTLAIPLINCEVSLTLTRSADCVLKSKAIRDADPDASVIAINNTTRATFTITDTKLYIRHSLNSR